MSKFKKRELYIKTDQTLIIIRDIDPLAAEFLSKAILSEIQKAA